MQRRSFLVMAASGIAWLSGCGDDAIDGSGTDDGSSSSGGGTSTAGPSTSSTAGSSGPGGTGSTTDDSEGSTGPGDTEGWEGCEGGEIIEFAPDDIPQDDSVYPLAVMAGEMKPESAVLAIFIADGDPKTLRVWQPGPDAGTVNLLVETSVEPDADGYAKVPVDGLCPGQWYQYAYFEPNFSARSPIGEFRTAIADDVLEPLTLAVTACTGDAFDWPALSFMADEYYDMFIHLGDMAYNDGSVSLAEYRASWKDYLAVDDMKKAYLRAGLYATWDDHEVDNNSSWDPRTMDPDELARIQRTLSTRCFRSKAPAPTRCGDRFDGG
jgi:alkaline phosphatase D